MKKTFLILSIATIVLSACASATPVTPTVPAAPTNETGEDTPYPLPSPELLPTNQAYPEPTVGDSGTVDEAVYPYPDGEETVIKGLTPAEGEEPVEPVDAADFAPVPGDKNLTQGPVYIEAESSGMVIDTNENNQVTLYLTGTLPNPCYQLRVNILGVEDNQLKVEAYSLADPDKVCADVLQPFTVALILKDLDTQIVDVQTAQAYVNEQELPVVEIK